MVHMYVSLKLLCMQVMFRFPHKFLVSVIDGGTLEFVKL